jgi:hypothetical protein
MPKPRWASSSPCGIDCPSRAHPASITQPAAAFLVPGGAGEPYQALIGDRVAAGAQLPGEACLAQVDALILGVLNDLGGGSKERPVMVGQRTGCGWFNDIAP